MNTPTLRVPLPSIRSMRSFSPATTRKLAALAALKQSLLNQAFFGGL